MTTEDVVKALARYTTEANATDQQTARILGIKRATLRAWLEGADSPQKCVLARSAGFLRRAGYL
jgi:transcriptional regulator with XRE-family HTH domain